MWSGTTRQLACRDWACGRSHVESSTRAVFSAVRSRRTLSSMLCPACGSQSRDGARFCAECGVPLEVRCRDCGAQADPADRFCSSCGASLQRPDAPPAQAVHEERKTVTCLYADLVGSTAAADRARSEEHTSELQSHSDLV